jgi:hypothetical protein
MKRGGLRLGALALAAAGLIEYSLQMILPVILVRHLTPADFGESLPGVAARSVCCTFVCALVPYSLFYHLPAAEGRGRTQVMGNALLFRCAAASLFALVSVAAYVLNDHVLSLDAMHRHFPSYDSVDEAARTLGCRNTKEWQWK